ncbi:MAG: hypothetical protein ACK5LL_09815 [Suipraeoptans sp.]
MEYTKKVISQSNHWYNDGLKKANIRDLSGAVTSLRSSLNYNRDNVAARNLLGLVYYGRGEIVEALVEWILSKNIQKEDNIAGNYIKEIQKDSSKLREINQAIKKYNISLDYVKQNSEDMALIQLKQAISEHPTFLKAHQLLALLYLDMRDIKNASKQARICYELDKTNEITLHYMHELNEMRKDATNPSIKQKLGKKVGPTTTYKVGNETIIQPTPAVFKDGNNRYTVINVIIGVVLGVAVMMFLIMPGTVSNKQGELNKQVLEFSDQIAIQDAQISALKKELETYRTTGEEPEAEAPTISYEEAQNSYEIVMSVSGHMANEDMSDADMLEQMLQVNVSALGPSGKGIYDGITSSLYPRMCSKLAESGKQSIDAGDNESATNDLQKVIQMNMSYEDGNILLILGQAYQALGNTDSAKWCYQSLLDHLPESASAPAAGEALDSLSEE